MNKCNDILIAVTGMAVSITVLVTFLLVYGC